MDLLQKAKEAESENDLQQAAGFYKQVIRQKPLDIHAYDRLMIIYRKMKDYPGELQVISKGIRAFENYYSKRSQKISRNKKVVSLSNALLKTVGVKGQKLEYLPEPLGRWKKRMEVVKNKLESLNAGLKKKLNSN